MKTLAALLARVLVAGLASVLATLALTGTAAAQDAPPDDEFTFHDDLVDGDRVGTDIHCFSVLPRRPRTTLLQPRPHFIPELMESVESI